MGEGIPSLSGSISWGEGVVNGTNVVGVFNDRVPVVGGGGARRAEVVVSNGAGTVTVGEARTV